MSRRLTPRLPAYAGFAAFALLFGLLFGHPEVTLIALPFVAFAAAGAALARHPRVALEVSLDRDRAVEGDEIVLTFAVTTDAPLLSIRPHLPGGVTATGLEALAAIRPKPGVTLEIPIRLRVERWGVHRLGAAVVRAGDPLGIFVYEGRLGRPLAIRAFPQPQRLRTLLQPARTQAGAGDLLSREAGEGIEFAEIRPYVAGDRLRRVNWRLSARRGILHVDQQHPERNADVVLFLDTFAGAGEPGSGTHDQAVRAASGLAAAYLRRRDRVGLVGFGGILRWLRPGMGMRQEYRVLEVLLESEVSSGYAWKDIDVIPPGVLPPQALLVALTPLLDERTVGALLDVRARGFDVAVVEVDPVPFVAARDDHLGKVAHRLWLLRREALRARFQELGVPVARLRPNVPLEATLDQVLRTQWRSAARRG